MIIGIISDTHGYFHPAIPEYFSGVDAILHAGDVGTEDILDRLEALAPTYAVRGNIDGQGIRHRAPANQRLILGDVRIWMTHIGGHPKRWSPQVKDELRYEPPDVFICGHSHILRMERVASLGGMLFINPGAAGRSGFHRVKTCLRLEIKDGRPQRADVIHLDEPAQE